MIAMNRRLRAIVLFFLSIVFTSYTSALNVQTLFYQEKVGNDLITIKNPNDKEVLPEVIKIIKSAKADLTKIGFKLPDITINASVDAVDFANRTGRPWFIAAIAIGNTITTQRFGALKERNSLELTLRHEIFHTAQPKSWPRWLAEGLARRFSGEFTRDPQEKTGLENISDKALEEALVNLDDQKVVNNAYYEATRRANRLLEQIGWKKLINWPK